MVILFGLFFIQWGYYFYGTFMIFNGFCVYLMVKEQEKQVYLFRQDQWDGLVASEVMTEMEGESPQIGGRVIAPSLIRSDKAFQKWRQSHRKTNAPTKTLSTETAKVA